MNSDEISSAGYLQELYNTTEGNTETQVSMHDIGLAIGIEKAESGRIAEGLMVQGYVELKTLAGGISITNEGLKFLGFTPQSINSEEERLTLSTETIANEEDRTITKNVVNNIKNELTALELDYPTTEQIILDLKAIEIHLLSPSPKNSVIIELFRSISNSFVSNTESLKNTDLSSLLG